MNKILVTGASSQDSILLSEFFLHRPTQLTGLSHTEVTQTRKNVLKQNPNFSLIENFDYSSTSFMRIIEEFEPDCIINLASISSVMRSFSEAELTNTVNYEFFVNLTNAVKHLNRKDLRIFQASSSEMFGNSLDEFQSETTEIHPISPYGQSKANAHQHAQSLRLDGFNISTGILFNHESEFRPPTFLSKKIAKFAADFEAGKKSFIELGNIHISRDWGSARDFVAAMVNIVEHKNPDDFVIATGSQTTVVELLSSALRYIEVDIDPHSVVRSDESLLRPAEKFHSAGNFQKIQTILGWKPMESIHQTLGRMINFEMNLM